MIDRRSFTITQFNREKYDRVSVMFPSGYRDMVRDRAKESGQSLNAYMLDAMRDKMGTAIEERKN